jgi:hypothetical protein
LNEFAESENFLHTLNMWGKSGKCQLGPAKKRSGEVAKVRDNFPGNFPIPYKN